VSWSNAHARRVWIKIHLWLGIWVGLFLALVGLSGSLLVFGSALAKWQVGNVLFPPGVVVPSQSEWAPVSRWLESVRARYPKVGEIEVVASPGTTPLPSSVPLVAGLLPASTEGSEHTGNARRPQHAVIAVDPVSGQALDMFVAERIALVYVTAFHTSVFLPFVGQTWIAICGLVFLISAVTGVYLWWPRDGRFGAALNYRWGSTGRVRLLSLHNVTAAWCVLPLVVVMLTGVFVLKPTWLQAPLNAFSSLRTHSAGADRSGAAGVPSCDSATSIDMALDMARAFAPGQAWRMIARPEDSNYWQVSLRRENDDPRGQSTEVWIDARCPRLLQARRSGDLSAGETVLQWLMPLHASLALGALGQAIVFATGLVLPLLYVTGLMMWLRRRRARRAAAASETTP
jgi:uncharacterized iron-regulated membrane protein